MRVGLQVYKQTSHLAVRFVTHEDPLKVGGTLTVVGYLC